MAQRPVSGLRNYFGWRYPSFSSRTVNAARMPWLIAFLFGLIHGLGFAGVLREIGLPEHAITRTGFWCEPSVFYIPKGSE